MKTKDFENQVKIGDSIIVFSRHYDARRDKRHYTFVGYRSCGSCPADDCPGHVVLKNRHTGR